MRRDIATLVLASALYGFSIGSVHSARFGLHDVIKFPLLFLVTGAACAVAYFLFARLVGGAASVRGHAAAGDAPLPRRRVAAGRARARQPVPRVDPRAARRDVAPRVSVVSRPQRLLHRRRRHPGADPAGAGARALPPLVAVAPPDHSSPAGWRCRCWSAARRPGRCARSSASAASRAPRPASSSARHPTTAARRISTRRSVTSSRARRSRPTTSCVAAGTTTRRRGGRRR